MLSCSCPKKIIEFHALIKEMLLWKCISLKQLHVLAGKLNLVAMVVQGSRRVWDIMKPQHASHYTAVISETMKDDLRWWDVFLCSFNGRSWFHPTSQWVNVYVHASLKGGGIAWGRDWDFIEWLSEMADRCDIHINVKEIMAISMAIWRWAPLWTNASVVVHTNNIKSCNDSCM